MPQLHWTIGIQNNDPSTNSQIMYFLESKTMTYQPTIKCYVFGCEKNPDDVCLFRYQKKIDKTWKTIAYKVNHNPILSNRHLFACPSQTGDYHIKLHHTKYTLVAHKTSRRFHTWNFTFCLIPSKVSPLSHFKIRRSWLRKLGIMCHYPHLIVSTKPEDFSL